MSTLAVDFREDRPETEHAVSRLNADGSISTLFTPAGGAKLFRLDGSVLRRPFEGASWSVDPATGLIRLDFLGKFLELMPFFYTPGLARDYTLWSNLNSAQRAAINPVLTFGDQDDRRNLKFSLDFTFYATQGMVGVGFALWNTDAEYEAYVERNPLNEVTDVGLRFAYGITFSFRDIAESGYTLSPINVARKQAVLVTGFPGTDGERISLDPISTVIGSTADRDVQEMPAGTYAFPTGPVGAALFPYRVRTPYEVWRSFLLFNTGAAIPSGATVLSANFFFVIEQILLGTPAQFQAPPYRLDIHLAKDVDGFGTTIEANSSDWNSMAGEFDHQFTTNSIVRQNITTPVAVPSRIATADDIQIGNPDAQGYTNIQLREATFTFPSWDFIFWNIYSANNTLVRQPKLIVNWTSGGRRINRYNRDIRPVAYS